MDSLVNYDSDDDNDFAEDVMVLGVAKKEEQELDANYDDVGMDESDEESNINQNIELGRGEEFLGVQPLNENLSLADAPLDFRRNKYKDEMHHCSLDRRHSIDMEMDDDSSSDSEKDFHSNDPRRDGDHSDDEEAEEKEEPSSTISEHGGVSKGRVEVNRNPTAGPIQCQELDADSTSVDDMPSLNYNFERETKAKEEARSRRDDNSSRRHERERRESSPKRDSCSKRQHSPERYSHSKSSRSPDRSWKSRRLEKRPPVTFRLPSDGVSNRSPREVLGEQFRTQIKAVEAKTGVTLPSYYNPAVMNPLKYAQQIQKRKLLWGNKAGESKARDVTPATTPWDTATFKGDNDGRMSEKFKRLMGMKTETSGSGVAANGERKESSIEKQEEMFSNMEAQYQVARMVTHTHRGVGLGYGCYQPRPPLQKNS